MTSTHVSATSGVFPGPTLITGSGGGVGLALAEFLLESRRGPIFCHFRSNGDEVKALLKRYDLDPERYSFQADLLDENQIRELRTHMESQVGPAWGLINLAGGSASSLSWKLTRDDFSKVMNDNLLTTFLCSREFIPGMRERGQGRIINTSSVVAFSGVVGAAHYCAAKAAVVGLTKSLALELAPKSITVNALALGYFEFGLIRDVPAPMLEDIKQRTPMKRLGTGRDLGGLVSYLLSREGGFSTGQVHHLNGGLYS